jgi:hypothetical protein
MDIVEQLQNGKIVSIGNKMYAICSKCQNIVQINKFVLGSLHICNSAHNTVSDEKYKNATYRLHVLNDTANTDFREVFKQLQVGEKINTFDINGNLKAVCGCVYATQVDVNKQLEYKPT